jgi:hypothetical protein
MTTFSVVRRRRPGSKLVREGFKDSERSERAVYFQRRLSTTRWVRNRNSQVTVR